VYNSTPGTAVGGALAVADMLRLPTQVVRDAKRGLAEFFDNFEGAPTKIRIAFHCHSQGGAVMDSIRISPEFARGEESRYGKYIGQIFTYGAASFVNLERGEGYNFVAPFDVVPYLNERNYDIMHENPTCVRYTSFRFQLPSTAHAFEGPSYQEAFQRAINSQYEVNE
jgi:hypothetical protein